MKLLVQADDYGFTRGVTAGILDAIEHGILRNTGMFTNMPETQHAASLIKLYPQACFGIDFNIVSGPSVSDPKLIPHLVDEDGNFIRSTVRVRDPKYATEQGRRELFPKEEVKREIQAQYDRFVELVGHRPGYLHGHSISPEPYSESVLEVAHENDVPFSMEIRKQFNFGGLPRPEVPSGSKKEFDPMEQINKDPEGRFWENRDMLLGFEYAAIGGHCGFVDAELFALTTLSIERARDHQLVTSKRILQWVKENSVQLITYDDLVKEIKG